MLESDRAAPLISALRKTPFQLRRALAGFTAEALRRPASRQPANVEAFSALGHACHLRDIEVEGYHVRIQRLRDEEQPVLVSLSGEQLAIERAYSAADPDDVLDVFDAARNHTLQLLGSVRPEEWSRRGEFEGEPVNLLRLVEILAGHDAGHLAALAELPAR